MCPSSFFTWSVHERYQQLPAYHNDDPSQPDDEFQGSQPSHIADGIHTLATGYFRSK